MPNGRHHTDIKLPNVIIEIGGSAKSLQLQTSTIVDATERLDGNLMPIIAQTAPRRPNYRDSAR